MSMLETLKRLRANGGLAVTNSKRSLGEELIARHNASRRCLLLLRAVIETPGLVDRLFEVLGEGDGIVAVETAFGLRIAGQVRFAAYSGIAILIGSPEQRQV